MKKSLITLGILLAIGIGIYWFFNGFNSAEDLQIEVLSLEQTTTPDEFVTNVFRVINRSDQAQVYRLEFVLPEEWASMDSPSSLRLGARSAEQIFVTVQVPPATAAGRYSLGLVAQLERDQTIRVTAKTSIQIRSVEQIKLRVPTERLAVIAGQESRHAFKLVNVGNLETTARISFGSVPAHWKLTASEATATLAPGESRQLWVHLMVPPDAELDEVELTVNASTEKNSVEAPLVFTVFPAP